MMNVQQFLLTHSLADLDTLHGVKARLCARGHKVSLNYDQIEAKDDDVIAQECRGLILTTVQPGSIKLDAILGPTKVLARPFRRFFNLGQPAAAPVDMYHPDTRFYEKLDGTLTLLYFDTVVGEWHVATRSVPESDLTIDGFGEFTFRTLFERACIDTVGMDFDVFTGTLRKDNTYIFELTTPMNRIVVDYREYGITLLGARDNLYGYEYDPLVLAKTIGVPSAPVFRFGNIQEMVDFVSSRNPQAHEGIVVCDPSFNRVKVKNPGYLALNKVRDSVMNSPRGLVELTLLEKLDDALPLFPPHIQERGVKIREAFGDLLRAHRMAYEACKAEADRNAPIFNPMSPALVKEHRKAFAISVQTSGGWMAPMMDQYQGKCDGLMDWIMKKRQPDGGWSNSFLDTILSQVE